MTVFVDCLGHVGNDLTVLDAVLDEGTDVVGTDEEVFFLEESPVQGVELHLEELSHVLNELVASRRGTLRCFDIFIELTACTVDGLQVAIIGILSLQDNDT